MDEPFDKFIEVDDGDSEKENENEENIKRQPKTTKEQFDNIVAFMEDNNEELIDKETFGLLWDDLAARLNDVGPPEHTVPEWKKIWSAYKYNRNRKRASDVSLDFEKPRKSSRLDKSPHVIPPLDVPVVEEIGVCDSDTFKSIQIQSELLIKLDVLIDIQNRMIKKQDEIIQELRSSKSVLQEIAKKV